jgi:hypothetical protein
MLVVQDIGINERAIMEDRSRGMSLCLTKSHFLPKSFPQKVSKPHAQLAKTPPVIKTLGRSVSEKEAKWELAPAVSCRRKRPRNQRGRAVVLQLQAGGTVPCTTCLSILVTGICSSNPLLTQRPGMLQPGARTRRARVMAGAKPVPFLSFSFF